MTDSSAFKFEIVSRTGVQAKKIRWNLTPPLLYEEVLRRGEAMIAENGPLVIYTGKATGRSAE